MKSIKRFILGITATLLLSAGLTRAADHLDPLARRSKAAPATLAPTPDCAQICNLIEDTDR